MSPSGRQLREVRELVTVSLGEGIAFFENVGVCWDCLKGDATFCRLLEEVLHPGRGEDKQHPRRFGSRVRRLVDNAAWYHDKRAYRGRDPTLTNLHRELSLEDVEGLFVVAVEMGQGAGRSCRDNVVVDREGAARVPVAHLEHHAATDRVGEGFPIVRSDEETFAFDLHPYSFPQHFHGLFRPLTASGSGRPVPRVSYGTRTSAEPVWRRRCDGQRQRRGDVSLRDAETRQAPVWRRPCPRTLCRSSSLLPAHRSSRSLRCCQPPRPRRVRGLLDDRPVFENPVPVRHERVSVPGGKTGHVGRLRVELVFEEEWEVRPFHLPQPDRTCRRSLCASGHVGMVTNPSSTNKTDSPRLRL